MCVHSWWTAWSNFVPQRRTEHAQLLTGSGTGNSLSHPVGHFHSLQSNAMEWTAFMYFFIISVRVCAHHNVLYKIKDPVTRLFIKHLERQSSFSVLCLCLDFCLHEATFRNSMLAKMWPQVTDFDALLRQRLKMNLRQKNI